MSNWHIGQQVVCVDDSPPRVGAGRLKKGAVYTIRGFDTEAEPPDIGLYLEEIPDDRVRRYFTMPDGWDALRFRPVKTTSIDIFTDMLAPPPRVKEHV